MARRRSAWGTGARVAYGLGQGATQLFAQMMRDLSANRSAERAADLQEARDTRTLARQAQLAEYGQQQQTRRNLIAELPKVASGELTPEAFLAMMQTGGVDLLPTEHDKDFVGTGEYEREKAAADRQTAGMLQSLRPPLRRKLESTLGADIDKAQTIEQVPDLQSIVSKARAVDDRASDGGLDPSMLVDASDPWQALSTLSPDVGEYATRAMDKANAFRNKPGERLTITNPDGTKTVVTPTAAQLEQGITTEPSAQQQGVIAGTKEASELGAVGSARAKQAGLEAAARRKAELAAEMSAMGLTAQQQSAALQLSDDFTQQSAEYFETARGFRNLATMAQRIQTARKTGGDSPASHIGLVFNFMKMQDPRSSVREGEQASVQNAGGVTGRIRNLYNELLLGGQLSNEQITDLLQTSAGLYRSALADHQSRIRDFGQRAVDYGVPAALVVREPDAELDRLSESPLDRLRRGQ